MHNCWFMTHTKGVCDIFAASRQRGTVEMQRRLHELVQATLHNRLDQGRLRRLPEGRRCTRSGVCLGKYQLRRSANLFVLGRPGQGNG